MQNVYHRMIPTLILIFTLGGSATGTALDPSPSRSLNAQIRSLVSQAGLGKSSIAVSVRDCSDNTEVVGINAGQAMIPASNMKIFSTGAAMLVLGGDFEFTTRLVYDGSNLILIGDGDPTTADPEVFSEMLVRLPDGSEEKFNEETILNFWVDGARSAGITSAQNLIIDDRVFDQEFVHPSWKADQLNRRYSAEVGGLNYHGNCIDFRPAPASGRPNWNNHRPKAPWVLKNSKNKSKNGKDNTPWIAGKAGIDPIEFRGIVKQKAVTPVPITVHDPPMFFAKLLQNRMSSAGITVGKITRIDPKAKTPSGESIEPVITTSLLRVIQLCNEESFNLYAESLLKRAVHARTGRPGSWDDADTVMKQIIIDSLGKNARGLLTGTVFADGSGLSRLNRINAALMTWWLTTLQDTPQFGEAFVDSLAEGGKEGTLVKRFSKPLPNKAIVDAKTGYINGVSCLSGYVSDIGGRRYAFSVLVNNCSAIGKAKKLQEKIVQAIATSFGN